MVNVLGLDELQRSLWLLSTPVNAEKNRVVPEFAKVKHQTSNRHKDLSLSTIQKDHQNVQMMFEFLAERDQFHIDTVLLNLDSGKVTDESPNVFQAQTIGESLIQGIAETSAFHYKFRKKDMIIIIKTNASVNIEDSVVEADALPKIYCFHSTLYWISQDSLSVYASYRSRSCSRKQNSHT